MKILSSLFVALVALVAWAPLSFAQGPPPANVSIDSTSTIARYTDTNMILATALVLSGPQDLNVTVSIRILTDEQGEEGTVYTWGLYDEWVVTLDGDGNGVTSQSWSFLHDDLPWCDNFYSVKLEVRSSTGHLYDSEPWTFVIPQRQQ